MIKRRGHSIISRQNNLRIKKVITDNLPESAVTFFQFKSRGNSTVLFLPQGAYVLSDNLH